MQHERGAVRNSDSDNTVTLDCAVYTQSAVLRACYSLADLATFDLSQDDGRLLVSFAPKSKETITEITNRLRTALVDFALREEIEARTSQLRNLIWQTAFGEVTKARSE